MLEINLEESQKPSELVNQHPDLQEFKVLLITVVLAWSAT